jgi:hypothetical protein
MTEYVVETQSFDVGLTLASGAHSQFVIAGVGVGELTVRPYIIYVWF